MSTLQVKNLNFDPNGNVKISFQSNTLSFFADSTDALSNTKISEYITVAKRYNFVPTGGYVFSVSQTAPNGYIAVTNNALLRTDYPVLASVIGNTFFANNTHFKTPPLESSWFSSTQNAIGDVLYLYIKT